VDAQEPGPSSADAAEREPDMSAAAGSEQITKPPTTYQPDSPKPATARWPVRLAVVLGVMTVLCLAAGAVVFRFYDKATRPDRTTPAIALQNYLYATLQSADPNEALKYACADSSLAALTDFRDAAIAMADAHGDVASFDWTLGAIQAGRSDGTAAVELERDTKKQGEIVAASTTEWIFDVRNSGDGWRVCAARQIGK
jgi:hypothetical protein